MKCKSQQKLNYEHPKYVPRVPETWDEMPRSRIFFALFSSSYISVDLIQLNNFNKWFASSFLTILHFSFVYLNVTYISMILNSSCFCRWWKTEIIRNYYNCNVTDCRSTLTSQFSPPRVLKPTEELRGFV